MSLPPPWALAPPIVKRPHALLRYVLHISQSLLALFRRRPLLDCGLALRRERPGRPVLPPPIPDSALSFLPKSLPILRVLSLSGPSAPSQRTFPLCGRQSCRLGRLARSVPPYFLNETPIPLLVHQSEVLTRSGSATEEGRVHLQQMNRRTFPDPRNPYFFF